MSRSVRLADIDLRVVPLGERALLLRPERSLEEPATLPRLGRSILDAALPGIVEVIATPDELCLVTAADPSETLRTVAAQTWAIEHGLGRRIDLPVCFDLGNDWDEVLAQTGLDRDDYLSRLRELTLEVAMYGFLPGFVYLAGLPEDLRCTRKESPTTSVEAGSLAVGGPWIGIYGLASPAGWQVLGRTPAELVNLGETPPTNLAVGDRLQLSPIPSSEYQRLVTNPPRPDELAVDLDEDPDAG